MNTCLSDADMGSTPSKSKTEKQPKTITTTGHENYEKQAEQPIEELDEEEHTDDDEDDVTPTKVKITKNTDFKEIRERVEASLKFLNSMEDLSQREVLSNLATISRVYFALKRTRCDELKRICSVLLEEGILDIFTRMWDIFHKEKEEFYRNVKTIPFKILQKIKLIFWNYSDKCPELADACYKDGQVLQRLMTELTLPELAVENLRNAQKRYMIKATFGILINVVRHCNKNKDHIRRNDGIDKLLEYVKSTYLIIKADAYIILAYCINDEENDKITTSEGVIKFIVKLLSSALSSANHVAKKYAFSTEEILAALNRLASSDENKKNIVEAGVLPELTKLLKEEENASVDEHYEAVNCVWTLAFHPDNRGKIIGEPGLIDAVKRIQSHIRTDATEKLNKACSSVLFVLGLEVIQGEQHSSKHVMISYNWDVQPTMIKLRDFLKENGYEVWIDVDKMQDSILAAMADAVENAAIVLIAMTDAYKNSNPCRTEAEYAYKRSVPILPLLLQSGYEADGWLGAMVGTKLYVDLSSVSHEKKFDEVKQQIEKIAAPGKHSDRKQKQASNTASASNSRITNEFRGMSIVQVEMFCSNWTKDDVQDWYKSIAIEDVKVLPKFDGNALSQLCKMLIRSPEIYYRVLREDLHFTIQDILSFTSAIEALVMR